MKRLLIFAALIALANSGPPVVTKLLRPTITLYDVNGVRIKTVPQEDLPKGKIPIVGPNGHGQIGISYEGNTVYLRPSEIITENYASGCLLVNSGAQNAKLHAAVSGGIQNGMGQTEMSCSNQ